MLVKKLIYLYFMTEHDQKKLLKAGFRLLRRNIRNDNGNVYFIIEEKTEKSTIWVNVNTPGSSDARHVEDYFNKLLKDAKSIRIN